MLAGEVRRGMRRYGQDVVNIVPGVKNKQPVVRIVLADGTNEQLYRSATVAGMGQVRVEIPAGPVAPKVLDEGDVRKVSADPARGVWRGQRPGRGYNKYVEGMRGWDLGGR